MAAAIVCIGFHPWKRGFVRRYLSEFGHAQFARTAEAAERLGIDDNTKVVGWGCSNPELGLIEKRHGRPAWHMEDGFIRSVGLGSDRTVPASLVLDKQGIYYDPRTPSDLESLLQDSQFSPHELLRAEALRTSIIRLGVSKYNIGDRSTQLPAPPPGKRVVLVPGQVEDDASILLGTRNVRTNAALLQSARAQRPDAFIVYKPHPDVVSGNRKGHVPEDVIRQTVDALIVDAPLPACLDIAHEVHTMTSLVGFEGLMRGLEVTTYGQPFYAGWGLTHDSSPHPRRTRKLTLDELVAGALIRYPMYLHPETWQKSTPEEILAYLQEELRKTGGRPTRMGWMARKAMKTWNAVKGVMRR